MFWKISILPKTSLQKRHLVIRLVFMIFTKNHEKSSSCLHGSPEMHFSTFATIAVFPYIINWKWRSRVGESFISAILRLCKNSCMFDIVFLKLPFSHQKMHNFLPERLQSGLQEGSLDTPVQPRTAQEGPRRAQENPGRAQEAPGSPRKAWKAHQNRCWDL